MQHRTLVDRPVSALGPAHRLDLFARGPRPVPSPDSAVPVRAIRESLDEGVVMTAGISSVGVAGQIAVAREVLGGRLVPVQDQFSPAFGSP